jgi:hypothetical protein
VPGDIQMSSVACSHWNQALAAADAGLAGRATVPYRRRRGTLGDHAGPQGATAVTENRNNATDPWRPCRTTGCNSSNRKPKQCDKSNTITKRCIMFPWVGGAGGVGVVRVSDCQDLIHYLKLITMHNHINYEWHE